MIVREKYTIEETILESGYRVKSVKRKKVSEFQEKYEEYIASRISF